MDINVNRKTFFLLHNKQEEREKTSQHTPEKVRKNDYS
jgi:hypothetical protein